MKLTFSENVTLQSGQVTQNVSLNLSGNDSNTMPTFYSTRKYVLRCLRSSYYRWPDSLKYTHDAFMIYLCVLVIVIGLVGNVLAICTFQRMRKSTTNVLLMSLAAVDSLVLLFYGYFQVYSGFYQKYNLITKDGGFFYSAFRYMVVPQKGFTLASFWIAVLIALERYFAVLHPMRVRLIWTYKRTAFAIVITLLLSLGFAMVYFWSLELVNIYDPCTRQIIPVLIGSKLNKNKTYNIMYTFIMQPILTLLLPFLILTVLNIRIILTLRKAEKNRRNLSAKENDVVTRSQNRSVTVMVVIVICIILICNTPGVLRNAILFGARSFYPHLRKDKLINNIWLYSYYPTYWLIALNSSLNFFVYVLTNRFFRKKVFEMCKCACRGPIKMPERSRDQPSHGQTESTFM